MELKPRSYEKSVHLVNKGVDIPNPLTLDIGDEVNCDHISGNGVKIFPGCRIYGARTVISAGTKLGAEGPVTIDDCQLGPQVELKAGSFSRSVFLAKANMGPGAQVREGCILEEEAGGAHCVGLKQTILFPFVTLGSLINFCDCLMAGGTSRKNHSEVGSSYIHFNFTPDGDKTTPSLIGDVPRGVLLNQPPIFLGGQGGMVGPLRMGYGNVVAAGAILRSDCLASNKLIMAKSRPGGIRDHVPSSYPGLERIVKNNVVYVANLAALQQWYRYVRKGFLEEEEFGTLMLEGLLDKVALARKERLTRLRAMAGKVSNHQSGDEEEQRTRARKEFSEGIERLCEALEQGPDPACDQLRDAFMAGLEQVRTEKKQSYIETIQGLPDGVSQRAVMWLQHVVAALRERSGLTMPSLHLSAD